MKRINLTEGQRFGRLTYVDEAPSRPRLRRVMCKCDCGVLKSLLLNDVWHGKTKSCGCLNRELVSKRCKTHGRSGTPLYQVWGSMVERCTDSCSRSYPRYGGRGIFVCEDWLKFENFLRDMGERPDDGTRYTIERINNNLGYSKENCKWATYGEQANNHSANVSMNFDVRTQNLTQWCRELNIPVGAMIHRMRAGWSTEEAFTTPHPSPHRIRRKNIQPSDISLS